MHHHLDGHEAIVGQLPRQHLKHDDGEREHVWAQRAAAQLDQGQALLQEYTKSMQGDASRGPLYAGNDLEGCRVTQALG